MDNNLNNGINGNNETGNNQLGSFNNLVNNVNNKDLNNDNLNFVDNNQNISDNIVDKNLNFINDGLNNNQFGNINYNQVNDVNNLNNNINNSYSNNRLNNTLNNTVDSTEQHNVNSNNDLLNNIDKKNNKKNISNLCKTMLFITITASLLMYLLNEIPSMDWWWNLYVGAAISGDSDIKELLDSLKLLFDFGFFGIVVIVTVLSLVFRIKDKKEDNDLSLYDWFIVAGLLNLVGMKGLTLIIYVLCSLIWSIKIKKQNKNNNVSKISDTVLVIYSIVSIILVIMSVFNVFEIFDAYKKINDNNDVNVEKEDDYKVTTFDTFLFDWGNKFEENKKFKINNVKLGNVTDTLYIDYVFGDDSDPSNGTLSVGGTVVIKHGDDVLYSNTNNRDDFNITYLDVYKDFILYGISYCDEFERGVCKKNITYDKIKAFNRESEIVFYDERTLSMVGEIPVMKDNSVFIEDKNVYAPPYNDFRVYDIKVDGDNLIFKTIVNNYESLFSKDYKLYEQNCNNLLWNSLDYDIQRVFQTSIVADSNGIYNVAELYKISSIKYKDYCLNRDVLNINKNS